MRRDARVLAMISWDQEWEYADEKAFLGPS